MSDSTDEVEPIDVTLTTNKGDIEATIFAERAPRTSANFLNLARQGFYDDLTFHRVIDDFMIQGGDPDGTGRGGPGYQFDDEFHPELEHDSAGTLSMANSGPDTNGSQFFITHKPTPHLDGDHAVFGQVTEGQDVVDSISEGDAIESVEIHDDPEPLFEDQEHKIEKWNEHLQ
ncbi:MAG: peptidylprolyl isomerase [bacterium]